MIPQIIYLSKSVNENEKLKSLAVFHHKTINTHYFTALELARYLLQLSGICVDRDFISNEEVAAKLYKQIKEIPYFAKSTFTDIYNLILSINDLRKYIVDDESSAIENKLPTDIFVNKNNAVKAVYKLMISLFNNENIIDEIGIIRFALENTKTFPNITFINYNDDYPLHLAMINKAAGKEVGRVSYKEDKPLVIQSYTKAFGQTNEIENVLEYIRSNNIPFDQCLIASAEIKDYSNIVTNYKNLYDLPIIVGIGTTILETRPGKLFALVNDWMDNLYNTDYLKAVIKDESFNLAKLKEVLLIPDDDFASINKTINYPESISLDSIIATVGDMKMSFDVVSNNEKLDTYKSLLDKYVKEAFNEDNTDRRLKELEFVERLINELNIGLSSFIEKYAVVDDDIKDKNALGKILKYLSYHIEYGVSYIETRKTIYSQNVSRESMKDGYLYFTSINNALSCLRPYLFIVGLSSNYFPGASKENPMLLDEDYEAFGVNKASTRNIERNKNTYFKLLNEAKDNDASIHLSYAYYNSQSLKEQNASSVLFESYKKENGENKTVEDFNEEFVNDGVIKYKVVEFFDSDILPVAEIGRSSANNKKIAYNPLSASDTAGPIDLTKIIKKSNGFSASSVTDFAHCPYLFFLKEVLKMEQVNETDIYQVIPANECGTLAHYLLETLDKSVVTTKEQFGKIAAQRFEEYLLMHRPSNIVSANLEKEDFVKMMENAYEMEGDTKTLFKEVDITCTHPSGIKIHGFPDKVIENPDGTVKVIDYKTGNTVKHYSDDIASMIQCTMYSYILEQSKKRIVSSFEYWYLKHNFKVYSTDNNKNMKEHYDNLDNVLKELKKSLTTGEFTPNYDYCEGCFYKNICMKGRK